MTSGIPRYNDMTYDAAAKQIFALIEQNPGKLTMKDLREISGLDKCLLYRAVSVLTNHGDIKRKKGFSDTRVDYFYLPSTVPRIGERLK